MKKKKNTDKGVDEENDKKVIRRTLRLEARNTTKRKNLPRPAVCP
jgi:hypothetical protein